MTIKNVLLLIFVALLSGCGPQVAEFQLYDGQERPIQDMAMIFLPADHYLVSLDGKKTDHRQQGKVGNAYYLLSGSHRIEVAYSKEVVSGSWRKRTYSVSPLPIARQFEAGHVYRLYSTVSLPEYSLPESPLYLYDYKVSGTWEAKILHEGTYELFITKHIGHLDAFNRKSKNIPQRWKDFLLMQVLSVREYTCSAPTVLRYRDLAHTLPSPTSPLWPSDPTDAASLYSDSPEKRSPEWPSLRQFLARHNHYLGEISTGGYESAIKELTAHLNTKKSNANIYIDRGVAYARKQMFNDAIADFTKAIELRPDYALSLAYFNRGLSNYKMNKYGPAKEDLLKPIKLDPKHIISDHAKAIIRAMQDK